MRRCDIEAGRERELLCTLAAQYAPEEQNMTPTPHREPGLPDDLSPDDPSLPGNLPPDDPLPDPNQPPDDPPSHDPTPPAPDPRMPGAIDLA
ncbi:hypothetical protein LMG3441_02259 [Achromobacter kerstersii]|uniref:Uncharacterized protein n=2 Tax=Alcaligenaceae TaxID=506 RepID=A0A6S7AM79_9BURK|nr:hypothetical protein LMG3441_02259 [Achromobacter kerstersii]